MMAFIGLGDAWLQACPQDSQVCGLLLEHMSQEIPPVNRPFLTTNPPTTQRPSTHNARLVRDVHQSPGNP